MSESWGAQIRAHRKGQKRTQADLAAALGMGVRTIVSAEHDGPIRGDVAARIISEVAPESDRQGLALAVLARVEPELYALAGAPVAVEAA
jgi:transcriptional regulator with XRE-family HTH domain